MQNFLKSFVHENLSMRKLWNFLLKKIDPLKTSRFFVLAKMSPNKLFVIWYGENKFICKNIIWRKKFCFDIRKSIFNLGFILVKKYAQFIEEYKSHLKMKKAVFFFSFRNNLNTLYFGFVWPYFLGDTDLILASVFLLSLLVSLRSLASSLCNSYIALAWIAFLESWVTFTVRQYIAWF